MNHKGADLRYCCSHIGINRLFRDMAHIGLANVSHPGFLMCVKDRNKVLIYMYSGFFSFDVDLPLFIDTSAFIRFR